MEPGIYILKKNFQHDWLFNFNEKILFPVGLMYDLVSEDCLPVCILSDKPFIRNDKKIGIELLAFKEVYLLESFNLEQFIEDWELVEI